MIAANMCSRVRKNRELLTAFGSDSLLFANNGTVNRYHLQLLIFAWFIALVDYDLCLTLSGVDFSNRGIVSR